MGMDLIIDTFAGYTRLTLNRQAARNALNTALLRQLAGVLTQLATDPTCRAVVHNGTRTVSGGHGFAGIGRKAMLILL